jgi:hypothetical protein
MDERAKTREYLADDDLWPNWPYFPMKNRQTGTLGFVSADNPLRVFLANYFESILTKRMPDNSQEFPSVDALLDAGWVGD